MTIDTIISELRKGDLLAYLLLGLSCLVILVLAFHGISGFLDYDEAYNLQVVDDLIHGKGYSSYGAIRGEGPWLFDPNITTGPVILFPLAFFWWLSGGNLLIIRLVMLAFASAYVLGILYFIGYARERLLIFSITIAVALLISFWPARILGEVPAAGALIWAAWGVSRNKALIAGLGVGLAVQIKLSYGLAGVAILLAWFLVLMNQQQRRWLVDVMIAAAAAITPTALFEIYRAISLGSIQSYVSSIAHLRGFLAGQHIGNWLDPNALGSKIVGLYQLLAFPGWIVIAVGIFTLWVSLAFLAFNPNKLFEVVGSWKRSTSNNENQYLVAAHVGLAVGGLLMLWGWFTQSIQLSARQGLPGLLLLLPTLAATTSYIFSSSKNSPLVLQTNWRWVYRAVGGIGLGCLVIALIIKMTTLLKDDTGSLKLDEQRQVAEVIRNSGATSISIDGWWQNPEFQLLAGVPGKPFGTDPGHQLLVVQGYQISLTGGDWKEYKARCRDVLYESSSTLVCWPRKVTAKDIDLKILDWGPQSTEEGVVPNAQVDGGAGIWIKLKKVQGLGPVKVLFSGQPATATYVAPSGDLITASIQPDQFRHPGANDVSIKIISTGKVVPVGSFLVRGVQ